MSQRKDSLFRMSFRSFRYLQQSGDIRFDVVASFMVPS